MNILVCMSVVPDTTTKIKFNSTQSQMDSTGIQWIINPWDELSLTRALELREIAGTGIDKLAVVTVGGPETEPVIRKALAVGADEAFRIDTQALDSFQTASELASFLHNKPFDLVLCGIESSDYNGAMVGGMLAELLQIPSISSVSGIEPNNGQWIFTREIDGGQQQLTCPTPLIAIVQKGIALAPRIPAMRGIMQARTKPLTVIQPLGSPTLSTHQEFGLPPARKACTIISPDNIGQLVQLLHSEARVI